MKFMKILTILGVIYAFNVNINAQTARVQVIHNSADLAAAVVDVWLNNTLLLDDFAFRQASPFVDAPAGEPVNIYIQPPTSTDTANAIARFTYTLEAGKKYIIVANGIVSATGYNPVNPFNLYVYDMGRESASGANSTDVLVFHGSTDAPRVDVAETKAGAGVIVDNLDYGTFQGYLELPTADYRLAIQDENNTVTVASFEAPLAALNLQGQSLVVFASGFLNPANNSGGEAFGLWVALYDGTVVELPNVTTDLKEEISQVPKQFTLSQNYPNPFNPATRISFSIPSNSEVTLKVYNILGSEVATLASGPLSAGVYTYTFDASSAAGGLSSGIYFYELRADNFVEIKKMTLLK